MPSNQKCINDLFYKAVSEGHVAVMNFFLGHKAEVKSCHLRLALKHGKHEVIKILVEHGADINLSYRTYKYLIIPPIVDAAFDPISAFDNIKLFLEKGANVNSCDSDGATALYIAVQENNAPVVKLLLRYGADVNKCLYPNASQYSPLIRATEVASIEIINDLIEKGANVNHTCRTGQTPLHFAVEYNRIDVAKLLLEKGTNIDHRYKNKTPLDIAIQNKNDEMIKLLCKQKLFYFIFLNKKFSKNNLYNLRLFDSCYIKAAKSLLKMINGEINAVPDQHHEALNHEELQPIYRTLLKK